MELAFRSDVVVRTRSFARLLFPRYIQREFLMSIGGPCVYPQEKMTEDFGERLPSFLW